MEKQSGKLRVSGVLCVGLALFIAQLACSATGGSAGGTAKAPQQTAAADTTAAPIQDQQPADATPNPTVEPTATKQAASGNAGGGFACFGTGKSGITCLSDDGWETYTEENSGLASNYVQDIAACPDGKIYAITFDGLSAFDGSEWESIPNTGQSSSLGEAIACGPDGSVWLGYFKGVGRYQDGQWTNYSSDEYATGEYKDLVNDVAIATDGTFWVASAESVSSFDGTNWTEYKEGSGFDDPVNPQALAVDSQNRVWMADSRVLYVFEGGTWNGIKMKQGYNVRSAAADPQGRIWLSTFGYGAVIFDGDDFTSLSYSGGEIGSLSVYAAAFDGAGRTWLGMGYGIDVLDGGVWTHYRMDNADLAENEIRAVAVVGNGPLMPEAMTKQPGSIAGTILLDGAPVTNAKMEFCVDPMGFSYSDESPCSGQPFVKETATDADGKFSIADLPVAYYILAVQTEKGWALVGNIGSDMILVQEGRQTNVGELEVKVY